MAVGRGGSRSRWEFGSVIGCGATFKVPCRRVLADLGPGSWIGVAFDLVQADDGVDKVKGPVRGFSYGRISSLGPNITVWFGPGNQAAPSGKFFGGNP